MRVRGLDIDDRAFDPPPTPWPAPSGAPVLLFGGTFDPPHLGHVELPVRARDSLFGDTGWLVYIPAARSPHKKNGPAASDADRVEMLRLATRDVPRCAVWTDEIDRAGSGEPSYWVDTLARAARLIGDDTPLRFLIGADQVLAFDRWRAHETILALAEPAVLLREPAVNREALRRQLQMGGIDPGPWMSRIALEHVLPAASTDVRDVLRRGGDVSGLIDPGVLGLIQRIGLYRAR